MDFVTVIAFLVGLTVGGILCAFGTRRSWRKVRRETTEQLKQSTEIQERHYSLTDMVYRSALEKIESGDLEGAKKELSDSIARFYEIKTAELRELASIGIQPDEPDWTGEELRAIEHDALRFESLRVALTQKQNEPAAD